MPLYKIIPINNGIMSRTTARILINDAKYSSWTLAQHDTYALFTPQQIGELPFDISAIDPIGNKYFTKDHLDISVFPPKIISSPLRAQQVIACILVLEGNKTYGRTENGKRLYYKCIPDDKHLPAFLVPYEPKLEFSKKQKNKYAVIKFEHWNGKHPVGMLVEVIGNTDNLDAFYEYQIYCKSLHDSIAKFTKDVKCEIDKKRNEEYLEIISATKEYNIIDDSRTNIFTIDPVGSLDYDDGFALEYNAETDTYNVHIYIANVFVWLETLSLWRSFSRRVATIYLPDRKRPMLPTILCDLLCSLQKNTTRFAFRMSMRICGKTGNIMMEHTKFDNVKIRVRENYNYEAPELFRNADYLELYQLTRLRDASIQTSNDVVSYWMVQMNTLCGEILAKNGKGIFRHTVQTCGSGSGNTSAIAGNEQPPISGLSQDVMRVVKNWQNTSGRYTLCNEEIHKTLCVQSYAHITSPIRRLVDLLNQVMFMLNWGMVTCISEQCKEFVDKWIEQLDYVNIAMRSIRKIQIDCEIMRKCFSSRDIMNKVYEGVVFERVDKNDGTFTYLVYLEKIKILSRIHSMERMENYSFHHFKIYLFEDEEKIKQKIKLQYIQSSCVSSMDDNHVCLQ